MFDEVLKSGLKDKFPQILFDESLKKHTSMSVGGPADGFLNVTEEEIPQAINFCRDNNIEFYVIGNGSNLVVRDKGFRGLIICVGKNMKSVEILDDLTIYAQAGAKLSMVSEMAAKANIGGFECLAGIPGNLGGAIVMNAGAYGGEIKDLIVDVTFYEGGLKKTVKGEDLGFGYRKSYFINNPDTVVVGATFRGVSRKESEIRAQMEEYSIRRNTTQPLEYPSAGSFFKRPEGYFAGKLVDDCGLRGFKVGGAMVSTKHAGFVINTGGATCKDIEELKGHISARVMEKFGVKLEPEVRFIGQ